MAIHREKIILVLVNIIGGVAVLGSYAWGILTRTDAGALWGGVPESVMPLYSVSMFTAAAGYLAFTAYLLFGVDAGAARVAGRFGYRLFTWLYVLVLAPSAAWMPLTFAMIDDPSPWTWFAVRVVLFTVGAASAGVTVSLASLSPRSAPRARGVAVAGSILFCFQTLVLDAMVWTAFFPFRF
ncbi:MAG: hypothetical protein JW838_02920 [Spirochaetes bacterium]|nr:hypothetical protein [Spirochaetota bacterium]